MQSNAIDQFTTAYYLEPPLQSMSVKNIPDCLCHYYESSVGPFRSLTKLPLREAEQIQQGITARGDLFASQRKPDYLAIRRELEAEVRRKFIARGGRPVLDSPHYLILGKSDWLEAWYRNGKKICIPLAKFTSESVSFTYGDTFPAMRLQDGRPHRGKVFRLEELPKLVQTYGLPQVVNIDRPTMPERYIEAQLWSDKPVRQYLLET